MGANSMSGSMLKAMPYVDKVNGDAGLAALSFNADRCEGSRSAVPVMVTPTVGYLGGVVFATIVLAATIGGRRR